MKQSLKKAIQDKFKNIRLSEKQLRNLQQPQDERQGYQPQTDGLWQRLTNVAGIAIAALVLGIMATFYFMGSDLPMTQRIANEVVKNHLHLKPLEVKANTIVGVGRYFTQLNFKPINSKLLRQLPEQMIGGRYCSIQGITAAQLRLKQKNGPLNTLYQTEYRYKVFGKLPDVGRREKPIEVFAKGIKVRIWVEKGVLFALTDIEK